MPAMHCNVLETAVILTAVACAFSLSTMYIHDQLL
jgi:hypothetical protein